MNRNHRPLASTVLLPAFLLATGVACEPVPTSEYLQLSFDDATVEVDTVPESGTASSAEMTVNATLLETDDDETEVVLKQYRLEYTLDLDSDSTEVCPAYANLTSIYLTNNTSDAIDVRAAGAEQIDFITDRYADGTVGGYATLTMQGNDQAGKKVEVSASFDISFGDY